MWLAEQTQGPLKLPDARGRFGSADIPVSGCFLAGCRMGERASQAFVLLLADVKMPWATEEPPWSQHKAASVAAPGFNS